MDSPWKTFARDRTLDAADSAHWFALLEATQDASANDVVSFLEAALEVFEDLELWPAMFDPLLGRPGLVERWRESDEPVRSVLGHGLLRAGHIESAELASRHASGATELLHAIARSYVEGEERALVREELAFEASRWPDGVLARAVREEALKHEEPLPASVARFAAGTATDREAMLLGLRAFTDETLDCEPVASWGLLANLSNPELGALEVLAREWIADLDAATPTTRFRAFRALLERGRAEPAHDALLSNELLDWEGDLSSASRCGLCGEPHREQTLPREPITAVVDLLFRLPTERALRFLDRADPAQGASAELLRRWLTHGREGVVPKPHHEALAPLPDPIRRAVERAGARVAVAERGHLPRLVQREVLASFQTVAADGIDERRALPLHSMLRNFRARVKRLHELNAPVVVLMRDASRLRTVERILRARGSEPEADGDDEGDVFDSIAAKREVALSQIVLRELSGGARTCDAAMAQLERLLVNDEDDEPNAAAHLEASKDPPSDAEGALGHFAFCALDIALGDHERTDQDDLYDIAERAMDAARRERSAAADASDHASRDAEERRHWWFRWLFEFVPEAVRVAEPQIRA